ncbi:hypothetical protein HHK36_013463 [Tetracentron sinense]|uniref:Gamma-glutamylcyclotransferase n=1 Tax=Tetracentron sinense TaxID=13715 RepID=A0A834Z6C0_TETSI|nr:hypothetical protein HHK36_013463 [Tetracentron sinense]
MPLPLKSLALKGFRNTLRTQNRRDFEVLSSILEIIRDSSSSFLCISWESDSSSALILEGSSRKYTTMVLWVFGYGSLVWNPGFVFDEKVIGFIKDYKRVFDLACIDHRGTPEHPARTCTLEATEGAICWGAAYCVKGGPEKEREAMEYLERRECEYDCKSLVDFYKEGETLKPALTGVLVFTSTADKESNKYYLGPAPLEEMASQIATAVGPCGNNRQYLFLLEKTLIDIDKNGMIDHAYVVFTDSHKDDSIIELANEVRKVLGLLGRPKDKKLVGPHVTPKYHIPPLTILPHSEAIAMDSL